MNHSIQSLKEHAQDAAGDVNYNFLMDEWSLQINDDAEISEYTPDEMEVMKYIVLHLGSKDSSMVGAERIWFDTKKYILKAKLI